jgi:hypothetical protein
MRSARLGLGLLLACGCGSSSEPDPGAVASLAVISGEAQEAAVGTELLDPVVVKVTDVDGRPVPNQIINFVVTSGGGSVFGGAGQTNAQGEARERWTLGTKAGEQMLEARAVDQSSGDAIVFGRITATAVAGPMTSLNVKPDVRFFVGEQVDLDSITEGYDQYGNIIPDIPFTARAEPPFIIQGTKLSSTGESSRTQVEVSSGAFSMSRVFTVLRNLNELTGGTGGWACHGDDGAGHTQKSVSFVMDSAVYDPWDLKYASWPEFHVKLFTTGTTTWTLEDGSTEVSSGPGELRATQAVGALLWEEAFSGLVGAATIISESPLSYSGGYNCYYWSGYVQDYTVFTVTK